MKLYGVNIPIAGHVYVEVEAETEAEAIDKAMDQAGDGEVEWEALTQFSEGNVCYCPQPWEVEAEILYAGEE